MNIDFDKYQGTGNDFIIINAIAHPEVLSLHQQQINSYCDRHFGIGADGLIILDKADEHDFKMIYFNADGQESSMCGNGGRCIVEFAFRHGLAGRTCRFLAIDGTHEATVDENHYVELKMKDVLAIKQAENHFILDTGSPHYVSYVDDYDQIDIVEHGKEIRYSDQFTEDGINVNLAKWEEGKLRVKTYERGVEDETYSCGTGVTAAAICAPLHYAELMGIEKLAISAKGGELAVKYKRQGDDFIDIWLCGPATKVFKGQIER